MVAIYSIKKIYPIQLKDTVMYLPKPDGAKITKLPRKVIRFSKAMRSNLPTFSDVDDDEPHLYTSTVMSVKTSRDGANRYITYDLVREGDGLQLRIDRSVSLTGEDDSEFRAYLKANGIKGSYWHDYVGCQEKVILFAAYPSGEIIEVIRMFLLD